MAMLTTTREQRGEAIAKLDGQIKRIDENTYGLSRGRINEYPK